MAPSEVGERRHLGVVARHTDRERAGRTEDVRRHRARERSALRGVEDLAEATLRRREGLDRDEHPSIALGVHCALGGHSGPYKAVSGPVVGSGRWAGRCACSGRAPGARRSRRSRVATWCSGPAAPRSPTRSTRRERNRTYTGALELPERLRATSSLEDACADAAAILVAVPSTSFRSIVAGLAGAVERDAPVLSLTKGVERGDARHDDRGAARVPARPRRSASSPGRTSRRRSRSGCRPPASSPSRTLRRPASSRSACTAPRFRVYTSADVTGCEVAGATKNVLAIAAGVSDGLGFGDNTRATIITRGLAEMDRLGVAMGGDARTFGGARGGRRPRRDVHLGPVSQPPRRARPRARA